MPRVARPDLVRKAICSGVIGFGFIQWKPACLARFRDDPEMQNFTDNGVKLLLRQHVCVNGHEPESRPENPEDAWFEPDDPYWYEVVIPVDEFSEGLFVKMKLLWEEGDSDDDAAVELVSVHKSTP